LVTVEMGGRIRNYCDVMPLPKLPLECERFSEQVAFISNS